MTTITISNRAEVTAFTFVQDALKGLRRTAPALPSASICSALTITCCATWGLPASMF